MTNLYELLTPIDHESFAVPVWPPTTIVLYTHAKLTEKGRRRGREREREMEREMEMCVC